MTTHASTQLSAGIVDRGATAARPSTVANLWQVIAARRRARPASEGLPVGPGMPQKFGDHYRWPDGTFHHCC